MKCEYTSPSSGACALPDPPLHMLFAGFLLLSSVAPQGAPAKHPPLVAPAFDHEKLAARIDELAKPVIEKEGVPGLSIAVGQDGVVFFAKGYGYADQAQAVPAKGDTQYELGTLTRQFTAVAILQLVDEKKLALDDELAQYLPTFPRGARQITLRAMLSNTSGIPGFSAVRAKHEAIAKAGLTEAEFCACFADVPFEFEPGDDFALDSANYVLLSMIVAKVSKESFVDYVKAHILDPVGLADTAFCPHAVRRPGFAVPCGSTAVSADFEIPLGSPSPFSTQCLCSNATDLVKWKNALFTRTVFSERAAWTIIRPTTLSDGNSTLYGFALQMSMFGAYKNYAHTGGTSGSRLRLSYYSLPRVTVAVLANCATAPVERIEKDIGRFVLSMPSPTCTAVPLSAEDATRYAGTYQIGTRRIPVVVREGCLWYSGQWQAPEQLIHVGERTFAIASDLDARVTFHVKAERCESFTILRGGFETRARRVD